MINLDQLTDILNSQLTRLSKMDTAEETLKAEIARSQAMTNVAGKLIDCADLYVRAVDLSTRGADVSQLRFAESLPAPALNRPTQREGKGNG